MLKKIRPTYVEQLGELSTCGVPVKKEKLTENKLGHICKTIKKQINTRMKESKCKSK